MASPRSLVRPPAARRPRSDGDSRTASRAVSRGARVAPGTTSGSASGTAAGTAPRTATRTVSAVAGSVLTALALVLIWIARSEVDRPVYVSELGADGEPTAALFETALLLVVAGGLLVAWAGRGTRAATRLLGAWTVSTSIVAAAVLFLVASQVPCTAGCPLPVGATFTVQDLVHTTSAVLAFAAACVAMLQASFVAGRRRLRVLSMASGVSVALIAAAGGVLSLLRVGTDVGGVLELVATTVAIGWLIVLGLSTLATGTGTSASTGPTGLTGTGTGPTGTRTGPTGPRTVTRASFETAA